MIRVTILAIALAVTSVTAQAALISWAASPDVPDADDAFQYSQPLVALLNGQDIYPGLWWDDVAGKRYFRLDIQGTPSGGSDYAEIYGIYIDAIPGGSDGPTDALDYIPDELTGIDYILDMHYSPTLGWFEHFHTWTGVTWTVATPDLTQRSNSDKQLEWGQDLADFAVAGGWTFWGATHSAGGAGNPDVTHDLTEAGAVPEPGTVALFGLGLAAVACIRRRRVTGS